MKQVNEFILKESPVSHYIEWAKKEECWLKVRSNEWAYNLDEIRQDFIDEESSQTQPQKRCWRRRVGQTAQGRYHTGNPVLSLEKDRDVGARHGDVAADPDLLASDIAYKIKNNRKLNDSDISRGYLIYENVWQHNPELLEEADSLAEQDRAKAAETSDTISPANGQDEITLELIQAMVEWDNRRRILEDWKWKAMKDVADGMKPLTDRMKYAFYFNLQKLKKAGFPN